MHSSHSSSSLAMRRKFPSPPRDGPPRRLLVRRATVFCIAAGLLSYLAIDGGAFDVVARQRLGLAVWGLVGLGLMVGLLPRARPQRVLLVPALFAVALVGWMLLSFAWTSSPERSSAELARLLIYLGLIGLVISSVNRHTFRAAAAGLSLAAAVVVAVALVSRLYPGSVGGGDPLAHGKRLSYPLDYWNAVGAWEAMAIAMGLAWSAQSRVSIV